MRVSHILLSLCLLFSYLIKCQEKPDEKKEAPAAAEVPAEVKAEEKKDTPKAPAEEKKEETPVEEQPAEIVEEVPAEESPAEEEKPAPEVKAEEAPAEPPAEKIEEAPAAEEPPVEPPTEKVEEAPAAEEAPAEVVEEIPAEPEEEVVEEKVVLPEKVEPSEIPPLEEPIGIDTVSLEEPQGNWLFKRIWWERAEERYEKIRSLVEKVWESRMNFFLKRNELDKKVLDPFYRMIGMGQGELQAILSELIAHYEKEREEEGMLSDQEREMLAKLETEQETLKQLKLDVETIAELDNSVDNALVTLMDQINQVRKLERDAWAHFKEVARVLSDKKARDLFYQMDGIWRNVKSISAYLEKDFADHFAKLIEQAEKHIKRLEDQIKAFKEKGIDFKKQVELIEQQEEQEKAQQMLEEEEDEEEFYKPKPKKGWLGWTYDMIASGLKNTWNFVVYIVRLPYDLIFGTKK